MSRALTGLATLSPRGAEFLFPERGEEFKEGVVLLVVMCVEGGDVGEVPEEGGDVG